MVGSVVTDICTLVIGVYEICMGIIVSPGQSLTTEGNAHRSTELLPLTTAEEHNDSTE